MKQNITTRHTMKLNNVRHEMAKPTISELIPSPVAFGPSHTEIN